MAVNDATPIKIQSKNPWNKGLRPTDCKVLKLSPEPIKNKVTVSPTLAKNTMLVEIIETCGI